MREGDQIHASAWPGGEFASDLFHDRLQTLSGHAVEASDDEKRELRAGFGPCGAVKKH
jgi:hypothetical protein